MRRSPPLHASPGLRLANSVLITNFLAKVTPTKRLAPGSLPGTFAFVVWKCDLGPSPNFVTAMSSRLTLVPQLLLHPPIQQCSVWRVLILIPPAPVNNLSASLHLVLLPSAAEIAAPYGCPKASD
jgi:hypothetical protein